MDTAFLNGEFVSEEELKVPATDTGFMFGVTIAEQIRTFNFRPFWLSKHLNRLEMGLRFLGIELPIPRFQLSRIVDEVIERKRSQISESHELGVTLFVTPGTYPTYGITNGPTIGVHAYPLPFHFWSEKYSVGHAAVIASNMQVPHQCWPAELKCRSRMHYYLASQEAKQQAATAVLTDLEGNVSESPIANVLAYFPDEGFVSPPIADILLGVSLEYIRQLSQRLGIPFQFRKLAVAELNSAQEVLLTSTPFCVQSIVSLNQKQIGSGKPGEICRKLIAAWSRDVGIDIAKQARLTLRVGS